MPSVKGHKKKLESVVTCCDTFMTQIFYEGLILKPSDNPAPGTSITLSFESHSSGGI
jgi:hypothetical protein